MSSPIYIPSSAGFDNNPASVSVITTSYTIPAGKFARVYVACHSGGTMSINGVIAVDTDPFLNVDVAATTTATYVVPTGYRATVTGTGNAIYQININSNGLSSTYQSGSYTPEFNIGPAGRMLSQSAFATMGVQGVAIPSNKTHAEVEFYLPSGTVITGAGSWRAVVQEYNAIS
jgi:hypothetical protein